MIVRPIVSDIVRDTVRDIAPGDSVSYDFIGRASTNDAVISDGTHAGEAAYFFIVLNTTDDLFSLGITSGSFASYFLTADEGSPSFNVNSNAGTVTYRVDKASTSFANRDAAWAALGDGTRHLLIAETDALPSGSLTVGFDGGAQGLPDDDIEDAGFILKSNVPDLGDFEDYLIN